METYLSSLVFSLSLTVFCCRKSLFLGRNRGIFVGISKLYTFTPTEHARLFAGQYGTLAVSGALLGIVLQHNKNGWRKPAVKPNDSAISTLANSSHNDGNKIIVCASLEVCCY